MIVKSEILRSINQVQAQQTSLQTLKHANECNVENRHIRNMCMNSIPNHIIYNVLTYYIYSN